MTFITFIKFLFNLKIWLSEKWDLLFPIKQQFCLSNNNIESMSILNNSKTYSKIFVVYEIDSKIYKIIYYDTNYNDIKKIPIKTIPFRCGIHKPILSMKIKLKKNDKYINISSVIPHIKEFNQKTIFNDFILFNVENILRDRNLIEERLYHKIYIKTLTKKIRLKYKDLENKTINDFYTLIK